MAVVMITGANRGIGRELARLYAARGDTVYGVVRSPIGEAALDGVRYLEADVTDDEALARVASALDGGALDLLIANAGMLEGRGGVADPDYTKESWARSLMTNVYGPFATVRAMLPALLRAKAAKVAILGSIMGSSELTFEKGNAYSYRATKAAAINIARNLAGELKGQGVAVGAYHPGWVRTDMGGSSADVSVEDSAAGLQARFDALSMASTGVFEDYRGAAIPF